MKTEIWYAVRDNDGKPAGMFTPDEKRLAVMWTKSHNGTIQKVERTINRNGVVINEKTIAW